MIGGGLRIESSPGAGTAVVVDVGLRAMSEPPVRVLLVDDHAVLRSGLRLLLEREEGLEPVGEAGSAEEALRALPRLTPDVVVIDIEMPGIGGLEGVTRIRERAPEAHLLVLSMHDQARDVRRAFDAGAHGYLPKAAADEDLVRAIRAVAAGERYVHPRSAPPWRRPRRPAGPSTSSPPASARCCGCWPWVTPTRRSPSAWSSACAPWRATARTS